MREEGGGGRGLDGCMLREVEVESRGKLGKWGGDRYTMEIG